MRMFLFLLLGSMFMTIKGQVPNTICQGLQQSISHCQQVCSSSTYYQQSCPQECNLCLAALTGGGIGGPCIDDSAYCQSYRPHCGMASIQVRCKKTCGICAAPPPPTIATTTTTTTTTPKPTIPQRCKDSSPLCFQMAVLCSHNTEVQGMCRQTCGLCSIPTGISCVDNAQICPQYTAGHCGISQIAALCPNKCGRCLVVNPTFAPLCEDKSTACRGYTKFYCNINIQIAAQCPRTCGKCPTPATTTTTTTKSTTTRQAGCVDHSSTCSSMSQINCIFSPDIQDTCPRRCGKCDPNAKPTPTVAKCEDKSETCDKTNLFYCLFSREIQQLCPKTCNQCVVPRVTSHTITYNPHTAQPCVDKSTVCKSLESECLLNTHVRESCPVTCKICRETITTTTVHPSECKDHSPLCPHYKLQCYLSPYVQDLCKITCDRCREPTTASTTTTVDPQYTVAGISGCIAVPISVGLFAESCLGRHNFLRQRHVDTNDLAWSETLYNSARDHAIELAKFNRLIHSNRTGLDIGENLAYLTGVHPNISEVCSKTVNLWYSEISQYSYLTPGFQSATGHFTQMVWKASTSVGIAMVRCANLARTYVVAQYSPSGNIQDGYATMVAPVKTDAAPFQ